MPIDAAERFEESRKYLKQELSASRPEATVVVSHFPPGLATRNQRFRLDPITAYFQANMDSIIDTYQPALWIYGHNHFSNDLRRGATRLVSNQLGYPSEERELPWYLIACAEKIKSTTGKRRAAATLIFPGGVCTAAV